MPSVVCTLRVLCTLHPKRSVYARDRDNETSRAAPGRAQRAAGQPLALAYRKRDQRPSDPEREVDAARRGDPAGVAALGARLAGDVEGG